MIIPRLFPNLFPDQVGTPPTVVSTPAANAAQPRDPGVDELAVEFKDDLNEVETEPIKVAEKPVAKPDVKVVEFKVEPKEEAKPEKEKVKQVTPIAEATKQEPKPFETKLITPSSVAPKARDYSGFSDEEQRVLKAMSNEAFDYASKTFKEKKELEKLKDASFLQHPDAYQLDPTYKQLQDDNTFLSREADYWESQLIAIENGQEWAPITGWKGNSPVFGPSQKPTVEAKIQIAKAMNQCAAAAQQSQSKLQQLVGGYQQRVAQDNAGIQQECAKRFSWVADPKLLEATVDIEGQGPKAIKDIRSDFVQIFPAIYRNTPGVEVAAHMFVALQIFGQKIRELENGKHVAEIKDEEVLQAEPTSKNKPHTNGKAINGVTEFSLEGMPV